VLRTVNNITASHPLCHDWRKKSGETSSVGQAHFLEGIRWWWVELEAPRQPLSPLVESSLSISLPYTGWGG